jgi:cell wall-associated NlpC family hydrolase
MSDIDNIDGLLDQLYKMLKLVNPFKDNISPKSPTNVSKINPIETEKRNKFVDAAKSLLGTPYEWGGGHGKSSYGLDCSGLVIVAARKAGITIPASKLNADGMWNSLNKVSVPQIGDLAFYGTR